MKKTYNIATVEFKDNSVFHLDGDKFEVIYLLEYSGTTFVVTISKDVHSCKEMYPMDTVKRITLKGK